MELKAIIREMLKKGMTEQQIKDSLTEIGIPNPDEVYSEATSQIKEVELGAPEKPAHEEKTGEDEGESLFEDKKEPEMKPEELKITSISGDGEKEVKIGDMLSDGKPAIMKKMPETSSDDIERKLDETISLLKALQDINKKILETERDVLLRLKQ